MNRPLATFHMEEARTIKKLLATVQVGHRVANESAGAMGATTITTWATRVGLMLEVHASNGGESAFLFGAPVAGEAVNLQNAREYLDQWGCLANPNVRALLENAERAGQSVLTEPALMDLEKQVQRDIPRFGPNVHIGVRAGLLREMLSELRAPVADQPTLFESWWASEIAANGGATIGADCRHWALRGWLANAPVADMRNPMSPASATDETYVDEKGTVWTRPTAWAYAQVCKARDKWQAAASASVADTPRVDELMAKWDDDGATRGPAFIELRDLARELERNAALASAPVTDELSLGAREHGHRGYELGFAAGWDQCAASVPVAGEASVIWKHTHRASGEVKLSLEDLAELPFNRDKWESVPHYAAPNERPGYVLVPVEPTPDMIEAGATERVTPHASAGHGAAATYKAMINAAPVASAPVAREAVRDAALEEAAQLIESTEETLAEEKPQQFVLRLLPRKNRDSISVSGFAWAQAIRARKTNTKEQ